MQELTARQQEILDLIKTHIEDTGYPPTRAEIADQLGFKSANAAEEHLKALARKGAIEMVAGASRGIRLPEQHLGIPIVGRVAAGNPILAEQNIEDYCNIPANEVHEGYFSSDKRGIFQDTNGSTQSDESTYELIMKNKEGLLTIYNEKKKNTCKSHKIRFTTFFDFFI